jgi:methyl-accepting chemotaxis protein
MSQWSLARDDSLNALGVPLLEIDSQGTIVSVNRAAANLLGEDGLAWDGQVWTNVFKSLTEDSLSLPGDVEPVTSEVCTALGDTPRKVRLRLVRKQQGYLVHVQAVEIARDAEKLLSLFRSEGAKVTEWLVGLSKGDFVARLELADPDEHVDPVLEVLDPVAAAGRSFRDAVVAMLTDVRRLGTAAVQGRLQTRADAKKHGGEFSRAVDGINRTLDAIVNPISVVSELLARIAQGQIPPTSDAEFAGDFGVVRENLNQCILGLQGMQDTARMLTALAVNDASGVVALDLPGLYGEVARAASEMRTRMRELTGLAQHVAAGEFSDLAKLEGLGEKRGRLCDNDQLTPAFIEMIRSIERMLDETIGLVNAARSGDLKHRASENALTGRFREVIRGVNKTLDAMLEPVETAMGVLENVVAHDLRVLMEGHFAGDHGRLQYAVNNMVDDLRARMRDIADNGRELGQTASQMLSATASMSTMAEGAAGQAESVASAVEDMDSHVQNVAAGIHEMSASITEIARNSANAMGVAQQAVSVAHGANSIVADLGSSSKQISKVLRVIVDIAQQTKLLSLNATIEAASAGDAGKGFAVVASEIKELAKETARATEDISQRVLAMQSSAERAIVSIQSISAVIHQIEATQSAIAAAVEEQTATTSGMAERIADTARRTSEIAVNISELDKVVAQTKKLALQSRLASEGLEKVAEEMSRSVSKFQV